MRRFIWVLVAVFMGGGLFGCSSSALKREAEAAVKGQLPDPASAEFRYTSDEIFPDRGLICGEVNSRDEHSALTGFRGFAYDHVHGVALASQGARYASLAVGCVTARWERDHPAGNAHE